MMEEEAQSGGDESAAEYLQRIQSTPKPQAQAAPGEESAADYLNRISTPQQQSLDYSISEGSKIEPMKAARVLQMKTKVPFPEEFISQNLDTLEAEEKQGTYKSAQLMNSNPKLSEMIAKSPNYSAALLKDLPNLKKLEMLYTRPAYLWPQSLDMVTERVTRDVESTIDAEWEANQSSVRAENDAGLPSATTSYLSKDQMKQELIKEGIADRMAQEKYIGGEGTISPWEAIKHRANENPAFWMPFSGDVFDLARMTHLFQASKAVNNDTATLEQGEMLADYGRMEAAAQMRGTSFLGKTTEMMMGLPAFAGEMYLTGGIYNTVEGGIAKGGKAAAEAFLKGAVKKALEKGFATSMAKKLAAGTIGSFAQSVVARTLHGASEEAKRAIDPGLLSVDETGETRYKGTGEGKEFSIPNVVVSAFADVASAHSMEVLKPADTALLNWFVRKNEGATLSTFQNALREGGINGVLGGMGQMEVAKLINAVGGVAPYQAPTLEDLGSTALGFGLPHLVGATGDVAFGFGKARKFQMQAEAFRRRGELLAESLKDAPNVKPELVDSLAKDGPHSDTYMPIKPFIEYWQGQNDADGAPVDPKAKAAELGIPAEMFDNAKNLNQRIKVPSAIYDTIIGQTKDGRAFDKEVTSSPLDDSGREADEQVKAIADRMKADQEAAKRSGEAAARNMDAQQTGQVQLPPELAQSPAEVPPNQYAAHIETQTKAADNLLANLPDGKYELTGVDGTKTNVELQHVNGKGEFITDKGDRINSSVLLWQSYLDDAGKILYEPGSKLRKVESTKEATDKAWKESGRRVRESVAEQLQALGLSESEVKFNPQLHEAIFSTLGKALGVDPFALAKRYPLKIEKSEAPAETVSGQQQQESGEKGRYYVGQAGLNAGGVIELFKGKNRSTFLHESGHRFLDVFRDVSESDAAPTSLKADWKTTLDYIGVKSGSEIGKAQHEQFARGFEQYLREGVAPTRGLKDAFRRFKVWLLDVYKNARDLNVELSPEIRGVFDRLLGAEAESKAAEKETGHQSLFENRDALKRLELPPEKEDKIAKDIADIHATNEEALSKKLISQMEREKSKEWADEKEALRPQIEAGVDILPEQRAIAQLKKKGGLRLDRDAIPKLFGDQYSGIELSTLPKGSTVAKGGIHPDVLAEMYGFASGKEMIRAIQSAEPRDAMVDRLLDGHMRATHGDLATNPELLHEEAIKTVHSDKASQLMKKDIELLMATKPDTAKKLIREVVHKVIPDKLLRERSENTILGMKYSAIDPDIAQKAEQQLHDEALNLLLRGDIDGAIKAKQQQLANHEFYNAALEAQEESDKIIRDSKKVLGWDKGLKAEYGQQMKGVLNALGIAKIDPSELANKKPLTQWIAEKEQSGETRGEKILLPESIKSGEGPSNWKDMTYAEIQDLGRGLKQLREYASEGDKLNTVKTEMRREDVKAKAMDEIKEYAPKRPLEGFTVKTSTFMKKVYAVFRGIDAALLKPEQFFILTGQGKIDSVLGDFLLNSAADAQAKELDFADKINRPIKEAMKAIPKEVRDRMLERVTIPGVERALCRRDIIGIVLNGGNESNYSKMVRGEALREGGLTENQIKEAAKQLTKPERDFVQAVWDSLEQMWPEVAALHKWATGLEPPKVEAKPMLPGFEDYRGGYFPLMYDRVESTQGQKQVEANVGGIQEQSYRRATLPAGYRQSRVEGYTAPIDFNIDRLPGNIAGMLKDLTHRKWMVDANWLVNDKDFQKTVRDHLGEEYNKMLQGWVKRVVNDRNNPSDQTLSGAQKFMSAARYNTTMVALGFRASTFLVHATGVGAAIDHIGPAAFADGVKEFASHPRDTYDQAVAKSGEMRHRLETADIDLRDNLRKLEGGLTNSDLVANIQKTAMYTIVWGNMLRDIPTWTGAYNKALRELGEQGKEGADLEKYAVYTADRAVRMSSGGGSGKDVAAIMGKDGNFLRLFTMFYTPGSALYSRLRDIGHEVAKSGNIPKFMMRTMLAWMIPAVLHNLATGKQPDESKDETWGGQLTGAALEYPLSAFPMGKEVYNDVSSAFTGEMPHEASSPMFKGLVETGKTFHVGGEVIRGDKDFEDFARQAFKTSGYYLGMPTGQLSTTGDYLLDIAESKSDPNDIGEFMHDVLFGVPRSRR